MWTLFANDVQVALLSQRGRSMLYVCQWLASIVRNVERSLLLPVTQSVMFRLICTVLYIGYRFVTIKCCSVVFGVTLRLLVINISSSFSAINKLRRLLPALSVTTCGTVVRRHRVDNTYSRSQRWQHAMKPDLGSKSRFLPTPPAFDAPVKEFPVGVLLWRVVRKTRTVWLPDGEKIWRYVYSFWPNARTWQTNEHTDRHRMTA